MTNDQIRDMVMKLVNELDYDIWKELQPDLAEDPEAAECLVRRMVGIARRHMSDARKKS